jgi:hypothetical protein
MIHPCSCRIMEPVSFHKHSVGFFCFFLFNTNRLCAVFLGIFVVNNYFTIDSLHFDENNSFQSIKLSLEEKQISGKYLIVGRDYEPFLKRELLKKSIEHSISIKSDYLKTMLLILKTTFISSLVNTS